MIHNVSEEFGASNITLTLDWAPSETVIGVTYDFSISPASLLMELLNESTSVRLVLTYNVRYNVSVTPILCGESNATSIIENLEYGELT